MVFHEITSDAIADAIDNWRDLDMKLVEAQEGRRVLDRLVGYEVSNVAFRRIGPGTSAGRVQSVATRLVVDRERARMAFHAGTYWDLEGTFQRRRHRRSRPTLVTLDGKRLALGRDFDAEHRRARSRRRRRAARRGRRGRRSPPGSTTSRSASRRSTTRTVTGTAAGRRSSRRRCSRRRAASSASAPARTMQRRAGPLRARPHHLHAHRLHNTVGRRRSSAARGQIRRTVRRRRTCPTSPAPTAAR